MTTLVSANLVFESKTITMNGTTYRTCENIGDCPDAGACLPGTCVEKIGDYSCSCPLGCEEGASAEHKYDCNRKSCGVPAAIDNADHDPSSAVKFNETAAYERHSGCSLDGEPDGNRIFTTTCGVEASGSVVVSPTPGISELRTTCEKITCGNATAKPFSSVSFEGEVFFQDVVKYTCEEGYTVNGSVCGSSHYEMRCESSGDLDYVVPGAETCEPVSCGNISSTDAPHATHSSGLCVYKETAVVTCVAGYSTNGSNYLANTYNVTCGRDGSFTRLDTRCTVVQCSVPEIPHATSQGGTTFGEPRNVTCEVGYTVTGLGGDERIQTIECMETGQFSTWKQCKQVSCGVPARVVSADIQVCADCEVHCSGSVPVHVQHGSYH